MAEADDLIELHFTFPSPDGAPEIAAALAHAGFPDVRLYVVVEATATSDDADLQMLHDRAKELAPMIDAANGGQVSHVSVDGWTKA
jgi:hypothetical protein